MVVLVTQVINNINIKNNNTMIVINGKSYKGNSLQINDNEILIDGRRVDDQEDQKVINITVDGNIDTLNVDSCDKLEITGDCGNVTSKNGDIQISGNIDGDVTNKNGNIMCRDVSGDVETKNGSIQHM